MIYNKEPMAVLYEYVKDLLPGVPIYKNFMDADDNSIPESYILLKARPTDNPKLYGDGETKIRVADSEITLISKGAATTSTNIHNLNCHKIEEMLKSKKVNFSIIELGYNKDLKNSQTTFEIRINYCV